MKKLTVILFACLVFCSIIYAEENTNTEQNKPNEKSSILVKKMEPVAKGPRMPGRAVLNCEYGDNYITIDLPDWSETADVTISDNDTPVWFCSITQADNTATLPALSGEYTVECQLDDESVYTGTLVF